MLSTTYDVDILDSYFTPLVTLKIRCLSLPGRYPFLDFNGSTFESFICIKFSGLPDYVLFQGLCDHISFT